MSSFLDLLDRYDNQIQQVHSGDEVMLAFSGISGIPQVSSSVSQDVNLDLVEQIIESAPRSATTFPLVYRAYVEVLERNGLSPSSDTAYYQFLLKLGVIRAPTWGERWDLWKATNTINTRKHTSPRKTREAAVRPSSAAIKARLPFLASASSDLDEGFDGDGESVVNDVERPSPRKLLYQEQTKSIVGHSPMSSADYDFITLDTPVRTSTPIRARGKSPPLPPYTESDISMISRPADDLDGPSTPRARVQSLQPEESDVDEVVLWEMERRADEFYETGLRGRCWDVWAAASDWVQKTTLQIDAVRSNILLRQTLARWRNVHRHHLSLPGTADAHREHHLKSEALNRWLQRLKEADLAKRESRLKVKQKEVQTRQRWGQWRNRLIKNRTQRWAKDMTLREEAFLADKRARETEAALIIWRERTIDNVNGRIADNHHALSLKRRILGSWHYLAQQRQELAILEADYVRIQRSESLSSAFGTWRKRLHLASAEMRMTISHEAHTLRQVWNDWRAAALQRQTALQLFERHHLSRTFGRWQRASQRIKVLRATADAVRARDEVDILRQALHTWIVSERGQLLRTVLDTRTLKVSVGNWKRATHRLESLEDLAQKHCKALEKRKLASCLSRWRENHGRRQNNALQADLTFESKIMTRSLKIWSASSRRLVQHVEVADNALRFFTKRSTLKCWKAAHEQKKREGWIARREAEELRGAFEHWMTATVQAVQDRRSVAIFEKGSNERLCRSILSRWTRRVVDIKSRELDMIEQRDTNLARSADTVSDAMRRWRASNKRVKELKGLMHSFRDVKLEDSLRSILRSWKHQAIASQTRKLVLAQAETDRDINLLKESLAHWRSRYREKDLEPIEEEVALRREDAIIFSAWDTWKAKSKKLHAVSMDNRRVKREAWSRWQRAVGLAVQAKHAKATADRNLLKDVFETWKDAAKYKASIRTTRIRGRIRPVSRVSEGLQVSSPHPQSRRQTHDYSIERSVRRAHPDPHQPAVPSEEGRRAESIASEPAYNRLRSELSIRRRGGSEEPENEAGNEVLRALRGALGRS